MSHVMFVVFPFSVSCAFPLLFPIVHSSVQLTLSASRSVTVAFRVVLLSFML